MDTSGHPCTGDHVSAHLSCWPSVLGLAIKEKMSFWGGMADIKSETTDDLHLTLV